MSHRVEAYNTEMIRQRLRHSFEIRGEERDFDTFRPVTAATVGSLTFIAAGRTDAAALARNTKAGVIVGTEECFDAELLATKTFIIVADPKLTFIRIVSLLSAKRSTRGIHPTAVIHPEAEIHPSASIGPLSYIGRAKIGAGSVVDGSCYIYDGVSIGDGCKIAAGCVIGADGFGHVKNEEGEWENFPHLAGVTIEDGVELAPNCCIARGALSDTVVRRGAKIDCLTQIGHNCQIGAGALILAQSVIGGSTTVGAGTTISIGSAVADYIKVGEQAFLGIGSTVVANVDSGARIVARPSVALPSQVMKRDEVIPPVKRGL